MDQATKDLIVNFINSNKGNATIDNVYCYGSNANQDPLIEGKDVDILVLVTDKSSFRADKKLQTHLNGLEYPVPLLSFKVYRKNVWLKMVQWNNRYALSVEDGKEVLV